MGRSAMMRSAPGEGAQCATGGGRGQASPRGCRRRLEQRSQKPTSEVYPRAETLPFTVKLLYFSWETGCCREEG